MPTKSISWGELADYQGHIEAIESFAKEILEECEEYKDNGNLIDDGSIFIERIQSAVDGLPKEVASIKRAYNKFCKEPVKRVSRPSSKRK